VGRLGHAESALCVHATGPRASEPRQDSTSDGSGGNGASDSPIAFPDRAWCTA